MSELGFIKRRFKQILPAPVGHVQKPQLRLLKVWLRDDVCPVVGEYAQRPAFRERAAWVVHAIRPGAATKERQEIEAVDAAMVECARNLVKLGSMSRVRAKLVALYPAQTRVVGETVRIDGEDSPHVQSRQSDFVDELALELAQVAALAKRPWDDLVNVNDYFEPQQEFVETADGQWLQRGEFIVSVNPELHPVGNFVVRCMFQRVNSIVTVLNAVHGKTLHAVRSLDRRYSVQDQVDAAWKAFQASHAAVKETFQTGTENRLRDSCMILTQVYAAFGSSPKLDWLDVSPEAIERGIGLLKHRITHFQNGEMFERIAAAVGDLRRLYVGKRPEQQAIDEAIARGGLVIDKRSYTAFWEKDQIEAEWDRFRTAWRFLIALAEKAGLQGFVEESDLYGSTVVSKSTMGTNAERLKGLLPASLRKHVLPGPKPRTYRLKLSRQQIYLFG